MFKVEDCLCEALYPMHTELKGKVFHRFKDEGVRCVLGITRRIMISEVNMSDVNTEYIAVF